MKKIKIKVGDINLFKSLISALEMPEMEAKINKTLLETWLL